MSRKGGGEGERIRMWKTQSGRVLGEGGRGEGEEGRGG